MQLQEEINNIKKIFSPKQITRKTAMKKPNNKKQKDIKDLFKKKENMMKKLEQNYKLEKNKYFCLLF